MSIDSLSVVRCPLSIGAEGWASPGAWRALARISMTLMWTTLAFLPEVIVEPWKGSIYCAVWLRPQNAPGSIMRPEAWHCTVLRCFPSTTRRNSKLQELVQQFSVLLQIILDGFLLQYRDPATNFVYWQLQRPPWPRSWNFGLPLEMQPLIPPLAATLETLIGQYDDQAKQAERVAAHISWH